MSHFGVLVILPKDHSKARDDVKLTVTHLLERYDENGEWFREGSRWDWWQIGGRWTGYLDGYDPQKDPANQERCKLCGSTGKRTDSVAFDNPHLLKRCNGCNGTGTAEKWPTEWKDHDGDIALVKTIDPKKTVFAVVTPDGEWHEKCPDGMGWFGVQRGDDYPEWRETYKLLLDQHQEHLAVIVDCHV